jgi:hypothetical protein
LSFLKQKWQGFFESLLAMGVVLGFEGFAEDPLPKVLVIITQVLIQFPTIKTMTNLCNPPPSFKKCNWLLCPNLDYFDNFLWWVDMHPCATFTWTQSIAL